MLMNVNCQTQLVLWRQTASTLLVAFLVTVDLGLLVMELSVKVCMYAHVSGRALNVELICRFFSTRYP